MATSTSDTQGTAGRPASAHPFSTSMPFATHPGLQTPEFLKELVKQDPAINTSTAAIWKSADWTVSIHTPELSSILELTGPNSIFPTQQQQPLQAGASSGSDAGSSKRLEANPFASSFGSVKPKSQPPPVQKQPNPFASSFGSAVKDKDAIEVPVPSVNEVKRTMRKRKATTPVPEQTPRQRARQPQSRAQPTAKAGNRKPRRKAAQTKGEDLDPEEEKKRLRRERNRIAAANCRIKKIMKLQELEDSLKVLRDEHTSMYNEWVAHQTLLVTLKEKCLQHMRGGCQGMVLAEAGSQLKHPT